MTALEKLIVRIKKIRSALCVGLDSDIAKIPAEFRNRPEPLFEFNKKIIDATNKYAVAYKPNSAFYEALGTDGWRQLEKTFVYLKTNYPDLVTILDAKRADIGSTSEAYAKAAFDVFGADAVTVSPYLGSDAIKPFLARKDKITIILCKTSNPGSGEIQNLDFDGKPLWQKIAYLAKEKWNTGGNVMLVVGATYPEELKLARKITGGMMFLVPGVGAQGGDLNAVMSVGNVIVNVSRGIIYDPEPGQKAVQYVQAMRQCEKIE